MGSISDESLSDGRTKRSANYRVRFRHGVFPSAETQATRADIKKYDYFFGGAQTWVDIHGNVDFIDESAQIAADARSSDHGRSRSDRRPSKRLIRTRTAERIPQVAPRASRKATSRNSWPAADISACSAYTPASSTASSSPHLTKFRHLRHPSPATSSISTSSLDGGSSTDWPFDTPTWALPIRTPQTTRTPLPISDPVEAQLFRFWVETIAPWWDMVSPQKIFKEVVPQMALSNPMLLNAVFMMASQHIWRFDPAVPARPFLYHERVLQQLIPSLAETGKIDDEATLMTAILLRGFEELHAGTRGQHHLSTFELFQGPQGWNFNMTSPVAQACFMVHVRFEIYQALLSRPSLRVDYRTFHLPTIASPLDDVSWSNRIVWICARILQWLTTDVRTSEEWHMLKDIVDEWERDRPHSFDAFFYREADNTRGRHFPELWFPDACHVDAHQHLKICRIALAGSYAAVESSDTRRQMIEHTSGLEVARWLEEMVAAARCNPHNASAPAITAHAMHRFAVTLQDHADQQRTIDFLEEVESTGWPTVATQDWLKADWGWHLYGNAGYDRNRIL